MLMGIYFWTYRTFPHFLVFKPAYFSLNNTKITQVNWFQARRVTNLEQLLSQLFDSIVSYIKKMIRSVNYSNYTQDANPEQTDILFVSSINFFSFFKCPILLILVILLSASSSCWSLSIIWSPPIYRILFLSIYLPRITQTKSLQQGTPSDRYYSFNHALYNMQMLKIFTF